MTKQAKETDAKTMAAEAPVTRRIITDLLGDSELLSVVTAHLAAPPDAATTDADASASASEDVHHLDDDSLAALIDGARPPRAVAHALRCGRCRWRLDTVEQIAFERHEANRETVPLVDGDRAVLLATLSVAPDARVQATSCSGAVRVAASAMSRRASELAGVSLRDHVSSPKMEIAAVPVEGAPTGPLSISVSWHAPESTPRRAQLHARDRLLADVPFDGHVARLGDTAWPRPGQPSGPSSTLRITVLGDGGVLLGTAWLSLAYEDEESPS